MDDLKRWAAMVPSTAESLRAEHVEKEVREAQLKAAFNSIATHIKESRGKGHSTVRVPGLKLQGRYLEEVIQVLKYCGYKVTGVSTYLTTKTTDLDLAWRSSVCGKHYGDGDDVCLLDKDHLGPHGVLPRPESHAVCGALRVWPSAPLCSFMACDLPKGHPGRCEAGTAATPRCGVLYEYVENNTVHRGICELPQGHEVLCHYSIDELNGLPGSARD